MYFLSLSTSENASLLSLSRKNLTTYVILCQEMISSPSNMNTQDFNFFCIYFAEEEIEGYFLFLLFSVISNFLNIFFFFSIHLFNRLLLSKYYRPDAYLVTGHMMGNKIDNIPVLMQLHFFSSMLA